MAMDFSNEQSVHQGMSSETLESMLISTKGQQLERKPRPVDHEKSPKCPRCESTNTKFCYYNNYSLSQPRYFCKSCRRYWTKGGTLRNIPVGGGCRKVNRRSSSSSSKNPSFSVPLSYGQFELEDDRGRFPANPDMHFGFGEVFQNLCSGMGDGINLGMGINGGIIGVSGLNQELGLMGFEEFNSGTTSSTVVTTLKQEICSNNYNISGESEIVNGFLGFPLWESNNNIFLGDGNMPRDVDSGLHGIGSPIWQGFLNTPLV